VPTLGAAETKVKPAQQVGDLDAGGVLGPLLVAVTVKVTLAPKLGVRLETV
jgi:hypothetical protein